MSSVILGIVAIVISVVSIIVSILAWHKSRAIYDIKKYKFPKSVGDSKLEIDGFHEEELRKKLSTGKWQILHIYEKSHSELMVIIGKIKK